MDNRETSILLPDSFLVGMGRGGASLGDFLLGINSPPNLIHSFIYKDGDIYQSLKVFFSGLWDSVNITCSC